jgi:hypothetical protein
MGISKHGAVSLGLTILIFLIIAFIVLVILSSAVRNYLIGGLNYFGSLFNQVSGSSVGTGTAKTSFIAYNCSVGDNCAQFPKDAPYFWYVDYNGQNLSANVSVGIQFTVVVGNYSFTAYKINYGGIYFCSNLSLNSGYETAGDVRLIYYFYCT